MTRVLPLPAPARISTGPLVVSTASRCCGFSWSRKDNAEVAPESMIEFYRGIATRRYRKSIRQLVASLRDSLLWALYPALPCRAFTCRRFAAGAVAGSKALVVA